MPREVNNKDFNESTCDGCGPSNIIETNEGYVCQTCGLMLNQQRISKHIPYNHEMILHQNLSFTQIGTKKERITHSNSLQLKQLNHLHLKRTYQEMVNEQAKREISRIFNCLELPLALKKIVFTKFTQIYARLNPRTKYRNPEKLVPLTIYFSFKYLPIPINERALLEISKISKQEFNAFKFQISEYFPYYTERDRKAYILQCLLGIAEVFSLGMEFYYQSQKILYKLWEGIKDTTDDVLTGLVASVSVLCDYKEKVTVNEICRYLGIQMSTIQTQVNKKIFQKFAFPGFLPLVKSSGILRKIMLKLRLVEAEIISITLGGAKPISKGHYIKNCKIYLIREKRRIPQLSLFKLFLQNNLTYVVDSIIKVDLLRISKLNGPPREGNLIFKKLRIDKRFRRQKLIRAFRRFVKAYSMCPICKKEDSNLPNCNKLYYSWEYSHFKRKLIDKMKNPVLLKKLNEGGNYFGIPCKECFNESHAIHGHISTIIQVRHFLSTYKNCPVCGSLNHRNDLLSFYHDKKKQDLRDMLIQGINPLKKIKNAKITLGIPCCKCFNQYFEK